MGYSSRLSVLLPVISALMLLSGCVSVPSSSTAADKESIAGGRALFESKGCTGCHSIEPPAVEQTISDVLDALGPELWYSGAKFKDGFLKGWLADPVPIRPMEYNSLTSRSSGNHPRLASAAATAVASFLMSLNPAGDAEAPAAAKDSGSLARRLFNYTGACYGCHRVSSRRGLQVGGLSGPSFLGARDRLRPEWIYSYLSRPDRYPVRAMPNYVGILIDAEFSALATYVAGLE